MLDYNEAIKRVIVKEQKFWWVDKIFWGPKDIMNVLGNQAWLKNIHEISSSNLSMPLSNLKSVRLRLGSKRQRENSELQLEKYATWSIFELIKYLKVSYLELLWTNSSSSKLLKFPQSNLKSESPLFPPWQMIKSEWKYRNSLFHQTGSRTWSISKTYIKAIVKWDQGHLVSKI